MNILIIDDEIHIREVLSDILEDENHTVFTAEDGIEGFSFFNREKIDICFLDVWMPRIGGIEVLQNIKENFPEVEVVMISGHAKINLAVKATKIGAWDFIEKPLSLERIIEIVKTIESGRKNKDSGEQPSSTANDVMIGKSVAIEKIRDLIDSAANSDARIMIFGENGTGKELVAREIHNQSRRRDRPFIGVNCAAIPENLIESELFGHVKGSFTGAVADRIGKFEQATTGTLFLDEIADMSLATQAKVLRVLQEMKLTRIGSTEQIDIDVRIITATNKDIKEEINTGNFREDLFYRLNVIPIYMPSLRERKDDIPLLIEYFIGILSSEEENTRTFTPEAMQFMADYSWPGNVRQLRNIVERLFIMITEPEISIDAVKEHLDDTVPNDKKTGMDTKYSKLKLNVAREEFERDFIEKKLLENDHNITKTAKVLGIYPSNLYSKLNKLGIDLDELKKG